MIHVIQKNWWWVGINSVEIVGENSFGNLLIKDASGLFWRLCPGDLYCKIIARNRDELEELNQDKEFLRDWHMLPLIEKAEEKLGPLSGEKKYCLKIPGILGGAYDTENIGICIFEELIAFAGYLEKEIKDLPDGAEIKFKPIA